MATIQQLCDDNLIPSSEVLAVLCPTLIAATKSLGIPDRELCCLYSAVYRAFKNRRSLLLLNFEKQVQFKELPWAAALEQARSTISVDNNAVYLRTLEDLLVLDINTWPHVMMPNKFVGALLHLANSTTVKFPFCKEVASDIFCHGFSKTFLRQAHMAASLLKGTIYSKYYEIDYDEVLAIKDGSSDVVVELYEMCLTGAGASRGGYSVVNNGKIIERCMIITTHNLAPTFVLLDLKKRLANILEELPSKTFYKICKDTRHMDDSMDWHTKLQTVKNAAYAWRQMVFYLAILDSEKGPESLTRFF